MRVISDSKIQLLFWYYYLLPAELDQEKNNTNSFRLETKPGVILIPFYFLCVYPENRKSKKNCIKELTTFARKS